MGRLWPKYIMRVLTKFRGVTFDSTEDWCKIWRKTDFFFQKGYEEFGKFSQPEKSKSKSKSKQKFTYNNQIDQMQCENFILPRK